MQFGRIIAGHQAHASVFRDSSEVSEALRSTDGPRIAGSVQPSEETTRDWARQRIEVVGQLARQADMFQAELAKLHHEMEAICGGHRVSSQTGGTSYSFNGFVRFPRRSLQSLGEHGESASYYGSERRTSRSPSRDGNIFAVRSLGMGASGDELTEAPGYVAETLPFKWPSSLNRREGLETSKHAVNRLSGGRGDRMHRSGSTCSTDSDRPRKRRVWTWARCLQPWMSKVYDPDSLFNAFRMVLVILLLLYDALLIPYMLGFDIDFDGWIAKQLFFTASFWTLDMCFSLVQGFEDDGHLQVELKQTAWRYMMSWMFPLDLFVVVLDWLTAILVSLSIGDAQSDRIVKVLRAIRLAGLLRLRKISTIVFHHVFSADIEASSSLVALISSILGFIVFFNHFQVCLWAYVGKHGPTDTGSHWVDMDVRVGDELVPYQDLNDVFKYTSIFHWHMAQLTVGNQGIHAATTVELAINIIGLLVALMMACTVVSALSATLVNYQMTVRARTQQLRTLQQYLSENRVSYRTLHVAVRQAKERVRKSSRLTEKDVSALSLLSTTLRSALRYEISLPFLRGMPLLRLWTTLEPTSAQQLCKDYTNFEVLLPHEVLYEAGEEAVGMLFLNAGRAEYVQSPRTSTARAETSVEVGDRKIWMCEAALCAHWLHVGTFQALVPCEIFKVMAHRWPQVLPTHHPFREVACSFAAVYYKRLVSARPPHAFWPDDLQVPYTRFCELVASMDPHVQQIIGIDALREAQAQNQLPEKKAEVLEKQVKSGKSVLFLDEGGQIKRVTSGVSLQILGANGKSLMQIGKIMLDGEVAPSCMVPGHISERDELPVESAKRLLDSKLRPLVDQVELGAPSQETETRMSQEYGISTEYMQLKFLGELGPAFHIPLKFTYGDPNVTVKACLVHRQENVITETAPQAFIFPGEKKGTSYCFAWLTNDELSELKQRADLVSWWLQELHVESTTTSPKESCELNFVPGVSWESSTPTVEVIRQISSDSYEMLV